MAERKNGAQRDASTRQDGYVQVLSKILSTQQQTISSIQQQISEIQKQMGRMNISGGVGSSLSNFSGERSSWRGWSTVHRAQARMMGYDGEFDAQPGQALRVGADDFDRSKIPAEQVQKAEQAWRSLVTTCQGVALDLVVQAQSPGGAWTALKTYYETGTQRKRRRLRQELYDTSMMQGENPAEFTQRVRQIVHELRHLGANVDAEEVTGVILKGLTEEYEDARKRLLDAEELTHSKIDDVLQQQFKSRKRSRTIQRSKGDGSESCYQVQPGAYSGRTRTTLRAERTGYNPQAHGRAKKAEEAYM